MILSHKHKFVFICNGKTATSSMEAVLEPYHEGEQFEVNVPGLYAGKHIPPAPLKALLGTDIWNEYFTFCFVRNPWDWFVSQFFWNWKPGTVSFSDMLFSPIYALRRYKRIRQRRKRIEGLTQFTEADIIDTYNLLRTYRGIYQADSLFQYNYVHDSNGSKIVDFVGRFESVEEDFQVAMDKIGINEKLPHRNATDHKSYRSYYTKKTRCLIAEKYSIDVNYFDYDF